MEEIVIDKPIHELGNLSPSLEEENTLYERAADSYRHTHSVEESLEYFVEQEEPAEPKLTQKLQK